MDNELDRRLQRLEAGQAKQSRQLTLLIEDQRHTLGALQQLAGLLQQPDEDGVKLHDVLAQVVAELATLRISVDTLQRTILQRAAKLA